MHNKITMNYEILLEQLAEIRAQNAALILMLAGIIEQQGGDPEGTITAIDVMTTDFANLFEDAMRKKAGLEPRAEPRTPVIPKLDLMSKIDWAKVKEQ